MGQIFHYMKALKHGGAGVAFWDKINTTRTKKGF